LGLHFADDDGHAMYILFNVIAGAMAIPNDLKEAARNFGLRGWPLLKNLDSSGDLSILDYWSVHGSRRRLECHNPGRNRYLGRQDLESHRIGSLY